MDIITVQLPYFDRFFAGSFQALRDLYPTVEELRGKITKTEENISHFAAVADYGRAGSLQVNIA